MPPGCVPVKMDDHTALWTNFAAMCAIPVGNPALIDPVPMLQECQPGTFTPVPGAQPVPYRNYAMQRNVVTAAQCKITVAAMVDIRGKRVLPGDMLSRVRVHMTALFIMSFEQHARCCMARACRTCCSTSARLQ